MSKKKTKQIYAIAFFVILMFVSACGQSSVTSDKGKNINGSPTTLQVALLTGSVTGCHLKQILKRGYLDPVFVN